MPFDGTNFQEIDSPLARRQALIAALRAPMRSGFSWDYSVFRVEYKCGTIGCAIGLAQELFPDEKAFAKRLWRPYRAWGLALGISAKDAARIFSSKYTYSARSLSDVRPHQVADQLAAIG